VLAARWLDKARMDLPVGLGVALVVAGVGVVGVAFTDLLLTAAAGGFTAGFGTGAAYVIAFTSIHAAVEDELRGRTFGTLYALARMGIVVSLAAAPLMATALDGVVGGEMSNGVRLTILISGVLVVSAGLVAGLGWRRYTRRESTT
jgi:dTMP kinase